MGGSGYSEKEEVLDEWRSGNDAYRLINDGAGPMKLQVFEAGRWQPESSNYVHGMLTNRIVQLKKALAESKPVS